MSEAYRVERGSLQHQFQDSRAKIQFFGGGFANGKTTAIVAKVIRVAIEYPGANILVARATRPKLNDTIRKIVFKWLPKKLIKSFNKADNTLELTNGTVINFRHISQQGVKEESTTSNLLSATYDLIAVDQVEDPEITYKDFMDLIGRLRGIALYRGDDPTMPRTGPRWMLLSCNPTRNWVYRKLIMPLHMYNDRKIIHPDLRIDPITGKPLIHLIEGATDTNRANLPDDYMATMKSMYTGQMYERYVEGKWGGFEGLIYSEFDEAYHVVRHGDILEYAQALREEMIDLEFVEGYDYGMAQPSCYILALTDHRQNTIIVDGFYQKEMALESQVAAIKNIRAAWGVTPRLRINADPSIFRRSPDGSKVVGKTVAAMIEDMGIHLQRGDNSINAGITKVKTYLAVQESKLHPFREQWGAPSLYVSDNLTWWIDEATDYYWERNKDDTREDKPRDKNDHAMDATKYMLSKKPQLAFINEGESGFMWWTKWHEQDMPSKSNSKVARYGRHA